MQGVKKILTVEKILFHQIAGTKKTVCLQIVTKIQHVEQYMYWSAPENGLSYDNPAAGHLPFLQSLVSTLLVFK